ncbi:hydroxyacid dehydrogenase [Ruania alkalisoli]|uniref:Hydroxyacid dehydrogenase n=1 Tax=Ruania alkalisoli TaxID=2779775 RepID=A0A7M1SU39_9MICO|nr:hydroxyacid dehydrogenase [Ruania alkalisoli]QOR70557.1 hydroxyacid dehydrogenase [Ruania alkalisoli]
MTPAAVERGERVAVLMSTGLIERIFSARDRSRLRAAGAVRLPAVDAIGLPDLTAIGPETEVVVTGWDSPALAVEILDHAPKLRLIAHTGGSIRAIVPAEVYDRGVAVTTVSAVLADAVAEFTAMAMIAGLRRATLLHERMRRGDDWESLAAEAPGRLLRAQTVGLVGASRVGRAVIGLLAGFGCRVLVSDPFLTPDDASQLGVELVTFHNLLTLSDVVSLHAPVLPETRRMIGAAELARMRDGALLINTARAALLDASAVLNAVRSGRLSAVLDVFDQEPLPPDSPWRHLENAMVTPHIAALTVETLRAQGEAVVDEIERFRAGESLVGEISREMYDRIA